MELEHFLRRVITPDTEPGADGYLGQFCLALRTTSTKEWYEIWFRWPNDLDQIIAAAAKLSVDNSVYFSSYLFQTQSSTKDNIVPSRTIQADLDKADLTKITIPPSVVVETSPGNHQGYWILDRVLPPDLHETLSRKLAYAIPECDRTGWTLGRKVRVPGTLNHKYDDKPLVRVVSSSPGDTDPNVIDMLPEVHKVVYERDQAWIDGPITLPDIGVEELWAKYEPKMPLKARKAFREKAKDRSVALFSVTCNLFRAGATREEVYYLALNCPNNKWNDLVYGGERGLRGDVGRAEQTAKPTETNVIDMIKTARKLSLTYSEKYRHIYGLVLARMEKEGEFIHTDDDAIWYLLHSAGRPIALSAQSEQLNQLLDKLYGMNPVEKEQRFVVNALMNHALGLEMTSHATTLSHFDADANHVLIHTGRRDVLRVTPDAVETLANGTRHILFQWSPKSDPFSPVLGTDADWGDILYGDALVSLTNYTQAQGIALLKVWTIFLLMRNAAVSRPILAALGPPGSSKSTLFRRVYSFLYGGRKGIGAITTPENFDQAVINNPFAAFDNVDTASPWLPDRLALSAATSDIEKRKLYSNSDTVELKRQAMVGVTSHNPRFGRSDVVDRLLIFNFERVDRVTPFVDETEIAARMKANRDRMWGAIIRDVQRVLAVDPKTIGTPPQFRIADFAVLGWRIAHGLGCADAFATALAANKVDQGQFTLEEEALLLSALQKMVARRQSRLNGHAAEGVWQSTTALWIELEALSGDPLSFKKIYRDAPNLGKKLAALQDPLKHVVVIDMKFDTNKGTRLWCVRAV